MSRESVEDKADRLLAAGRVCILRAGERTVARVEGDHATYAVVGDAHQPLHCECPAGERNVRCSHLIAVELVVVPNP